MPLYAKKATRLRISENWRCIKWKISNFSGSTPVCHLLCSKSRQKFTQTSFAQKLYCIGHIFVPTLKAHVHSVMHGQLWKPQHTYVKCVIWKSHFKLNRAFNFILVGVSRNPEWIVDIMYKNVNRISDTYVNIANLCLWRRYVAAAFHACLAFYMFAEAVCVFIVCVYC